MARHQDEKTNALRILDRAGIAYTARSYEETEGPMGTREYGVRIAEALGQDPARCFKTLAGRGASGGVYVFCIPVAQGLDLKKAARAAGEKSVSLLAVRELLPVTGYVRGGCGPIGMKKRYPTVIHESALAHGTICVSAGKIGAQVELSPGDLIRLLDASTADLTAS